MQIIFKKLRFKNFLAVGNYFIEIDLHKNQRTLIVGDNGAGKTTIIEALYFALFGKAFSKKKKPQLVNNINKKGAIVELEFTINKNNFVIKRGINPDLFEIYKNGNLEPKLSSSKEYQEHLENTILFLNQKSFKQFGVLGSSRYNKFMDLEAASRREIIEDLLDSNIFSKMNVLLKSKFDDLKLKIQNNKNSIDMINQKLNIEEKYFEQLSSKNVEQLQKYKNERKNILNLLSELKQKLMDCNNQKNAFEKKLPDIKQLKSKQNDLQNKIQEINIEKKKTEKDIQFFNDNENCPTCKQDIAIDLKENTINEYNKKVDDFQKTKKDVLKKIEYLSNIFEKIEQLQKKIQKIENIISNVNNDIFVKTELLQKIENQIQEFEKENDVSDIEKRIKDLKEDLKKNEKEKNELMEHKEIMNVSALLLKDSGIKTVIIKKYIPLINKLINQYLASMDFYCNFELDEEFNETIKQRHRNIFTYDSFSEGQKARIDLAILFTWRMISKLRNKMNINILFMDETFDSSLDGQGTDELLKILDSLTDVNIFIISHKEDLKERIDDVIKFKLENNFTKMVQNDI